MNDNVVKRGPVIRPVRPADLGAVINLCAEHAAYEGAASSRGESDRLAASIFEGTPRLWCFVVEDNGAIVGYATCTRDFSTWRSADYLHMDCLYLVPEYRSAGIGTEVMARIAEHARALSCTTLEWQTPAWNENAIRFYQRLGAVGSNKVRFTWVPASSRGGTK